MPRAGYIAQIARRAAASVPAPLRPRRVPGRLPGDGAIDEASTEPETHAPDAPGFAPIVESPTLSTVVAPRSPSAPPVAVAAPPVSAARAMPPAPPPQVAVTGPSADTRRARRARSTESERASDDRDELAPLPSPRARAAKAASAEPVAAHLSKPERELDAATPSREGRPRPTQASTSALERARALPQRNVPAAPDPLLLALAAAVRWTSSDERPTPRAVSPIVAQAPSTDAPARREEPRSTPTLDARSPVAAPATRPTIVPRTAAAAPSAPRSATPAPTAPKGGKVSIGSLHVEVLPAPPPPAAESRRFPAAAPATPAPLARGLTSHIGLRQS